MLLMKLISIQCANHLQFQKVLILLTSMEAMLLHTDATTCTIRCSIPVKPYVYIKRKWVSLQITDLSID